MASNFNHTSYNYHHGICSIPQPSTQPPPPPPPPPSEACPSQQPQPHLPPPTEGLSEVPYLMLRPGTVTLTFYKEMMTFFLSTETIFNFQYWLHDNEVKCVVELTQYPRSWVERYFQEIRINHYHLTNDSAQGKFNEYKSIKRAIDMVLFLVRRIHDTTMAYYDSSPF